MGIALVLAVVALSLSPAAGTANPSDRCGAARVLYTRYPGADRRLSRIPWIRAEAGSSGLVGLLWYWPQSWQRARVREARIFTHGEARGGSSTKILWAFLDRRVRNRGDWEVVVTGRRLDAAGSFTQRFAAIFYDDQDGAPSYASIVDIPAAGCWKLTLTSGDLRGSVTLRALDP
jgi:hypothetical protein